MMPKSEMQWVPGEGTPPDKVAPLSKATLLAIKERNDKLSPEATSSTSYAGSLVERVMKDNPLLTEEKAQEMIDWLA